MYIVLKTVKKAYCLNKFQIRIMMLRKRGIKNSKSRIENSSFTSDKKDSRILSIFYFYRTIKVKKGKNKISFFMNLLFKTNRLFKRMTYRLGDDENRAIFSLELIQMKRKILQSLKYSVMHF